MNTGKIVDRLGEIKAKIAVLTEQERTLKEQLIESGVAEAEGELFRATINHTTRCTLDMDAVRAKLSPQFIAAHTNETPVTTVRVVARIQAKAIQAA